MNGFLLDPLFPAISYEHPFEPEEACWMGASGSCVK